MKIYHYNPETLELLGATVADQDPLIPGNWLVPAYATSVTPPESVEGKTIHFNDGTWGYQDIPTPKPTVEPPPYEPTYAELRAREYPPMSDYLDGIVKGDQAQVDKYVADCQAVKAKYPKGSS